MPTKLYSDNQSEIWLGNSLDSYHVKEILGDRIGNALIFDAPFSDKTHNGHSNGKLTSDRAASFAAAHMEDPTPESRYSARKSEHGESGRRDIDYAHFSEDDCRRFSDIWLPHISGWSVSITDHVLAPCWGDSFEAHGRYQFSPIAMVETGSRVRMVGDGPSQWSCWVVVARPKSREYASYGALPGAYVQASERKINSTEGSDRIVGGKPLKTMINIVSDYSRLDELVIDPCAGGGTTGQACYRTGRRFIGIEKSEERAKLCAEIMYAESKMVSRKSVENGQGTLF
jgi:DNA methylase